MNSAHYQRILTALTLVLLIVAGLYFGGPVLLAELVLFASATLWEFYSLFWTGRASLAVRGAGVALGIGLILAFHAGSAAWVALILLAALWAGNMRFLFRFGGIQERASYSPSMVFFTGLLYIPTTFQLLLHMSVPEIVMVLLAPIASDTAAFYAGTYFGKARIWPQISPKKSWVGAFASMAACVAVVTAFGVAFGSAPWWVWPPLGALLNVGAQMGDFFESALKRKLGVKDSGALLPGHGGFLDRVDSLLLVIPLYALVHALYPLFAAPGM